MLSQLLFPHPEFWLPWVASHSPTAFENASHEGNKKDKKKAKEK